MVGEEVEGAEGGRRGREDGEGRTLKKNGGLKRRQFCAGKAHAAPGIERDKGRDGGG